MEKKKIDLRIKSLRVERGLKQSGEPGRVDVIDCLAMAPDNIHRTRRNGAGFNPLRIICTGLTFGMG